MLRVEYTENIREPLRYLLDQSGSLPKPVIGKVASIWTSQNISANGSSPVPIQDGRDAEFVVLTSSSAEVVVQSEYRSAPFSTGFTVASQSTAIQGKTYHLHAYFWNRNRELREADVPLKIGGWRNSDLTNN